MNREEEINILIEALISKAINVRANEAQANVTRVLIDIGRDLDRLEGEKESL